MKTSKIHVGWSFSDRPGVSFHIGHLPGHIRPAFYVLRASDNRIEVLAWLLPKPRVLDEAVKAVAPLLVGAKMGGDASGVEG